VEIIPFFLSQILNHRINRSEIFQRELKKNEENRFNV